MARMKFRNTQPETQAPAEPVVTETPSPTAAKAPTGKLSRVVLLR